MDFHKFVEALTANEVTELKMALEQRGTGSKYDPTPEEMTLARCRATRVQAIKDFRNRVGCSLVMAKAAIDRACPLSF